jgi:foldase protein PrsA
MLRYFRKFFAKETAGVGRANHKTALVMMGLLLIAVLTGCAATGGAHDAMPLQGKNAAGEGSEIVARVNGVSITRSDVKTMATRMARGGDAAALDKEALDRLILGELAYERAKEVGLTITPADIDNEIKNIKDNVGDNEMFRRALLERKMTEVDLRKELERDLLITRIIQKEVQEGIVIDPEELKQEIEKTREELSRHQEKVDMRAIHRSVEKKLKLREEKKRMDTWESDLRKRARIELVNGGDGKH